MDDIDDLDTYDPKDYVIATQRQSIDQAIDLLEALVLEEDANPEKIEEIINVLEYA